MDDQKKMAMIGTKLNSELKELITECFIANKLIFAWGPEDMPSIPIDVISHKLGIQKGSRPVRQKKRTHGKEH